MQNTHKSLAVRIVGIPVQIESSIPTLQVQSLRVTFLVSNCGFLTHLFLSLGNERIKLLLSNPKPRGTIPIANGFFEQRRLFGLKRVRLSDRVSVGRYLLAEFVAKILRTKHISCCASLKVGPDRKRGGRSSYCLQIIIFFFRLITRCYCLHWPLLQLSHGFCLIPQRLYSHQPTC